MKFLEANKLDQVRFDYKYLETEVVEDIFYSGKIASTANALHSLQKLYDDVGKISLVIAQPNAGKTYAVNTVYQARWNRPEMEINLIVSPNCIQISQNQKEYGMVPIMGGKRDIFDYKDITNKNFSVIVDKCSHVLDYLKKHPDIQKINLTIDEAHSILAEANTYREEAISGLIQLIDYVIEKKGTVVCLTATPDSLRIYHFDKIYNFKDEKFAPLANEIELVTNEDTDFIHTLYQLVKNSITNGYIPLVFLNDKTLIKKIVHKLKYENKLYGLFIDSSQKGFLSESENIYENEMYDGIINRSQLVTQDSHKREVKYYFTTSVLEMGTNILSVGGVENSKLLPIYACNSSQYFSLTSVIQSFNRVRFHVEKFVICLNKPEKKREQTEILQIGDILKEKLEQMRPEQSQYNEIGEILNQLHHGSQEVTEIMNYILQQKYDSYKHNHEGCMYYDDKNRTVSVNELKLWCQVISKFDQQFYYDLEALKEYLEEKMDIHNITSTIMQKKDFDAESFSSVSDAELDEIIQQIQDSPELQEKIVTDEPDALIDRIRYNKKFVNIIKLMRMGAEFDEAVSAVSFGRKGIQEEKMKLFQKHCQSFSSNVSLENLRCVLNDYKKLADIIYPEEKQQIITFFLFDKYVSAIRQGFEIGLSLRYMLDKVLQGKDISVVVTEETYKYNNRLYLEYPDALDTKAGCVQKTILDKLLAYNENGNIVQKRLTEETLQDLGEELQTIVPKKSGYKNQEILKLVKLCFSTRKIDDFTEAIIDIRK